MKKSQKLFAIDELKEKFNQAKALVFTDYSGLKVEQINKLRQEIKKDGAEFEVAKNTLLFKASENGEFKIEKSNLEGNTAILWLYSDNIAPLKTLDNFIKKNELPKIKFGFWSKNELTAEQIKVLANLPGLEELRAKLIGSLKSPLYRLHSSLKGNLIKLVYILKAEGFTLNEMKGGEN
ncbi:MAG: 50S ribosomal protein L10 [Candidatus Shapirobacteria bacterium]|nr:50S ribosomal protein L10 [Candidatus Shapirobacteria bacterium]